MESVSDDMVLFSSGGQIKRKQVYLWSSHVAGQSGGKTASEPGTALTGRLDRGQLHRRKPQSVTPTEWFYIIHCIKQCNIMASSLVTCLASYLKQDICLFGFIFTRCHVSIQICRPENIETNTELFLIVLKTLEANIQDSGSKRLLKNP